MYLAQIVCIGSQLPLRIRRTISLIDFCSSPVYNDDQSKKSPLSSASSLSCSFVFSMSVRRKQSSSLVGLPAGWIRHN
ncbi:hypothetical protein D3C76_1648100 [compost metagenome]